MAFFKTPQEKYNQFMSELTQLSGQIQYHQQLANEEIAKGGIQGLAGAGKETKKAELLLAQAKKVALELRSVCAKLKVKEPQIVGVLLGEIVQEKRRVKTERARGLGV